MAGLGKEFFDDTDNPPFEVTFRIDKPTIETTYRFIETVNKATEPEKTVISARGKSFKIVRTDKRKVVNS